MAPPRSDFDREMRALDSEIKRLEADYNMFFAGRLPRLPWERRARVEALVKNHDRAETGNTADRFRFQTLQARFVKFVELWERQLKAQEEGRPTPKRPRARRATTEELSAPASPSPAMTSHVDRVLHTVSFAHAAAETDRVKELYEHLADAKRAVGEPAVAYDRIAALVLAQLAKHGTDGSDVAFRVAVRDGKVSLTVKPVKGAGD